MQQPQPQRNSYYNKPVNEHKLKPDTEMLKQNYTQKVDNFVSNIDILTQLLFDATAEAVSNRNKTTK